LKKMLQVFHDDVAKVDLDVAMLHMCLTRVTSVLSECWIFHKDISSPSAACPLAKAAVECEAFELAGRPLLPHAGREEPASSYFLIFLRYKCCNQSSSRYNRFSFMLQIIAHMLHSCS
jgi:hypothetical protein